MKVNINPPKKNIVLGVQRINSGGFIKQVYRGPDKPTDPNILIWIDTSGSEPIGGIQFITKDNLEFITANNENFIVKES